MSNVTDWTLYTKDGLTFWYSPTLNQSVWELPKPAIEDTIAVVEPAVETTSVDSEETNHVKVNSKVTPTNVEAGRGNPVISGESESSKARNKKSKLPREKLVVRKEKLPVNYTQAMCCDWLKDHLSNLDITDINVIPRGDYECISGFVHFDIEHNEKSCNSDCLLRAKKYILGISIPESNRTTARPELALNTSLSEGTTYDSHKFPKQTSPYQKKTHQNQYEKKQTSPHQKQSSPFGGNNVNDLTSALPPQPIPIVQTVPTSRPGIPGSTVATGSASHASPYRPRMVLENFRPYMSSNIDEYDTTALKNSAASAPAPRDNSAGRVLHYQSNKKAINDQAPSSNANASPGPKPSQRPSSRPKTPSNVQTARKPKGAIVEEITIENIPHMYPEFEDRLLGPLIGDYLVDVSVKDNNKVTVCGDNLENVTLCVSKIVNLDSKPNVIDQNEVIHIFVDESNIKRGSRNSSETRYVLDCAKLLRLVTQYRKVQEVVIVGSTTEENIEPVERARRAEWGVGATGQVQIMRRDAAGREVGVDNTIMSQISSRLTRIYPEKKRKIVLLTGDGNSNHDQGSFPEAVERALVSERWDVEVWNWQSSCSRCYKDMAEAYVGRLSLHYLEPYVDFLSR